MILYVGAALALTLALVMFSMAQRHKTLLDPSVEQELLARIAQLTPESRSSWGRMSVGQMLRHLTLSARMTVGDLPVTPKKGPLRLPPLKQLILFVLPFPKSAPTAPALLTKDEIDVKAERAELMSLLAAFKKHDIPRWPDHPAFGPLSREDWGVLVWKHVDHHLRQFGV